MKNSMFNGPKVILFNGPKGCGKDDAVKHCQMDVLDATSSHIKMAHPLYYGIQELFSIDSDDWYYNYNYRKDIPSPLLMGMSPREALIWLSEEIMKPKFGSDFFGNVAGRKVVKFFNKEPDGIVLMSDAGFNDEVKAMVNMVGSEYCYLVRIYNNSDFTGDSREYVDPQFIGINSNTNFFTIYNTGSLAEYRENVKLVVKHIESRNNV